VVGARVEDIATPSSVGSGIWEAGLRQRRI
jgi:hypothetical protein